MIRIIKPEGADALENVGLRKGVVRVRVRGTIRMIKPEGRGCFRKKGSCISTYRRRLRRHHLLRQRGAYGRRAALGAGAFEVGRYQRLFYFNSKAFVSES